MDAHHVKVSVSDLITSHLVRVLRSWAAPKSVGVIVDRKRKTTFIALPVDPYGESYVVLVVIASDCLWPWSPKEVAQRLLSAFRSMLRWFDRLFASAQRKPRLLGGTMLFVGALSRGAYVSRPTHLLDYLRRCGVRVDYGSALYLMKHDIKVMTRDIRDFNRWFRMWLRSSERAIKEVFGSLEGFLSRAKDRLIYSIRFLFSNLSKWIARFAEKRRETCKMEGIEPYGKLRETIEYLKTLSAILATLAQHPV